MPHEYAPEEARALFDKVREQYHAALRGADIRLIFAPGKLTWAGREVTTKVALASPREFDLQEIDAWVLLSRAWWNEVRPSQATSDAERAVLTALVKRAFDHSLCELAWDEDRVRLVTEYAHGEFPAVVDRWGTPPGSELEKLGEAFVRRHQRQLPFGCMEEGGRALDDDGTTMTISSGNKSVTLTHDDLQRLNDRLAGQAAQ